jgi:ribosomal protein S19E (S16A)
MTRVIVRSDGGWISTVGGGDALTPKGRGSEMDNIKSAMMETYGELAASASSPKVSVDGLRDGLKSKGYLDTETSGRLSSTGKSHFRRAKNDLLTEGRLVEADGVMWKK